MKVNKKVRNQEKYVICFLRKNGTLCYLTDEYNDIIDNLFGYCFIWGHANSARFFLTYQEALSFLRYMYSCNTGLNAFISVVV